MDIEQIFSKCDHTLLRQDSTASQIRDLCDQAIANNCASVCIPPFHVAGAKRYVGDNISICTVIGFPNGYATTAVKAYEAADAIKNGADEIDMVVNISMVKDNCWNDVRQDIREVRAACKDKVLKVIIECCLLTEDEKIKLCGIVAECNADFIKTSTGFSTGGATIEDVKLLRKYSPPQVKVKAAGGIHTIREAEALIEAGADRIGSSHLLDDMLNTKNTLRCCDLNQDLKETDVAQHLAADSSIRAGLQDNDEFEEKNGKDVNIAQNIDDGSVDKADNQDAETHSDLESQ